MLALIIDSCTERSLVALVEDGSLDYFSCLPFGLHNSESLLPKVEEGLKMISKTPQQLDFIAVGVGPGSYTGIRVGASIAKGLSYPCKVPLIGVSSLEGFTPDRDGSFAAIIDARIGGAYVLKGEREGDSITYTTSPEVFKIEHLGPVLEDVTVLVGPFHERLRKRVEKKYPDAAWIWEESAPDPLHLYRRAHKKFEKGEYSLDGTLELLYTQSNSSIE